MSATGTRNRLPAAAPALGALLLAATVHAQAPTPPERRWYDALSIHGYADVYYGFNFNRPADGASFLPGTGTSGKRANNLALNLAAIDVAYDAEPVSARLVVHYGTGVEVLYAREPQGVAIGQQVFQYVQQATVGIRAPLGRVLLIEAGIFPGHVGFEVFPSKDNWNYTRPWNAEFVPYDQAGLRLAYAFTDQLSAQLFLLNGWQIIGENNEAKTIGTQLSWSGERLSASLNTLLGPELPGDNTPWRLLGNLILGARPTGWLSLSASGDLGYQQIPEERHALWWSAYLWARAQALRWLAFAARGGYFHDRDGFLSGTAQALGDVTGTVELRPRPSYILKIEGRYDRSSADVFTIGEVDGGGGPLRRNDAGAPHGGRGGGVLAGWCAGVGGAYYAAAPCSLATAPPSSSC